MVKVFGGFLIVIGAVSTVVCGILMITAHLGWVFTVVSILVLTIGLLAVSDHTKENID